MSHYPEFRCEHCHQVFLTVECSIERTHTDSGDWASAICPTCEKRTYSRSCNVLTPREIVALENKPAKYYPAERSGWGWVYNPDKYTYEPPTKNN